MHVHLKPFKRIKGNHVAAVFDNAGQFLDKVSDMRGTAATKAEMTSGGMASFYSNENWSTVRTKAGEGDAATAKRAASLMSKIAAVSYATPKRKRVASPYGRVSVGAYLASDPYPCRRHVKQPSDRAPLSIVVSLNSIASVSADKLERRGVAIAALVRRLVADRPVTLYLSRFSEIGEARTCLLVKFPTAPLDSHRLAYLTSSQGFARGAGFAFHRSAADLYKLAGSTEQIHHSVASSDYIAFAGTTAYSQSRKCAYADDLSDFLGEEVLYIPGSDPAQREFNQMVNNPVEWINETMAALTTPAA